MSELVGKFGLGSIYKFEQIRDGEVIDSWEEHNLIPNAALNDVLSVYLRSGAAASAWYLGIFENNYTPTSGLTSADIGGAVTECTAYTEATREVLTFAAPSSQSITNAASVAEFSINATKTIYGGFISSNSGKGAATGTIFSAVNIGGGGKQVSNGDILRVTVTVTASAV